MISLDSSHFHLLSFADCCRPGIHSAIIDGWRRMIILEPASGVF
jgi:hypothetical protein